MSKWIRENLVLVSGIVLPLLLVGGFFILSTAPRMLADPPQFDFLLVGYHYDYQHPVNYTLSFEVRDGKLTGKALPNSTENATVSRQSARIIRYSARDNAFEELVYDLPENLDSMTESVPLNLGDAENLTLDKRKKSPDGYQFKFLGYRGRGGLLGEMFGMRRSRESHYILNQDGAHFILPDPSSDPYYYQNDLHFMGWVTAEGDAP